MEGERDKLRSEVDMLKGDVDHLRTFANGEAGLDLDMKIESKLKEVELAEEQRRKAQ